jgi:beta-glucanase (GH16 family)
MNQSVIRLAFACYCTLDIALATPPAPPAQFGRYQLVFSDEFNNLDLGTSQDGTSAQSHTWYEGVWFNKNHAPREDFLAANSALSLTWKRGQLQSDSSVSTFSRRDPNYHAWRYGYFEARMKWRPEEGAWPAFWMIPVQPAFSDGPMESGEIDIFEGQGSDPHTFFGTIHRWSGQKQLASSSPHNHFPLSPNTDFSQFHTYGLLWVPGRVTWYFDDVPLHSETTYDVFDRQDFFLVLAMQEGSDWKAGDLTGVSAETLTLTVDWVRVWQLHSK